MTLIFSLLLVFASLVSQSGASTEYDERLVLQPLTPASLFASFNFRSNATLSSFERQNFRFFPRSLGQIIQHAKTKELHLRFSTGRWDDESWGARPWGGAKEGGTGVELWAWIDAETDEEAFARWITLNHALSGLFCASLNFIDSTRTTRPVMSFDPVGDHKQSSLQNFHLLHGTLPREVVCTENLTPFLKLLPCKGKAGIASLLDGHKLFDASWQTMAIDVRPVCPKDGTECVVEMEQTVDMVLAVDRAKRPRDNPIPRPIPQEHLACDTSKLYSSNEACFPLDDSRGQSWTVAEIFGRPITGSCLATGSQGQRTESLCLNVPSDRIVHTPEDALETTHQANTSRCYTLPESSTFDMTLSHIGPQTFNPRPQPPLYATRSLTGHGQERGGVLSTFTNPSSSAIELIYLESLPWFMKPYLHTLQAHIAPQSHPSNSAIKDIYYRPALDRIRGTQLELHLSIPPSSTTTLAYDFDKAILRYTEYPPDANRGFDVAPAVIRILPSSTNASTSTSEQQTQYVRTTSLLLQLPTPDFSMPYNVIILTSTVMALAFGSIFNPLTRRFVAADEVDGFTLGKTRERIRERVGNKLEAFRRKLFGKGVDGEKKIQ